MPLVDSHEGLRRELWSSRNNAPLPLVITISGMLLGIWAIIGIIIFQLFKIRELGK